MQCPKITAIILAAGKGSRYGMPKVDAVFGGITFLERIRDTLHASGITDIFVARDLPTADMLESLQYAASRNPAATAYIIYPVDHIFVQATTIVDLTSALNINPNAVIRPLFEARAGHPIIIPSSLDLWMPDISGGLAEIIRKSGLEVIDLPTTDQGVILNVNRPEDIARYQGASLF